MKNILMLFCLPALLTACGGGKGGAPAVNDAAPVVAATLESSDSEAEPLDQPEGEPVTEAVDSDAVQDAPVDFTVRNYFPEGSGVAPLTDDAGASASLDPQAAGSLQLLYVSPAGSDSNPGTIERPFRSLIRAAKASRAGGKVLVAPGVYEGGFRTNASGAPGARILFLSTRKWGAKIIPSENSPNKTAWDNRGSHVDIVGFEIDGSAYQRGKKWVHGIYNGGSYVAIRNNHVHHIAQTAACTHAGGAAIGVDSYYGGVKGDVISNLVHDIGPAGCRFVQGIYVSTSGRVQNNVIYRVAEGGIHLWHDANNVIITNNTVTQSNTGIIIGGGNYYHSSGPNDHTAVYSNIVYDNKMGISEQGQTGRNNTYRNNLVYQNARYDWRLQNGLSHTGTVSAAPLFLDNSRSSDPSLKLSADSPAVGHATPEYAESIDFAGRPRDARAGYDIGALQH
ncbi:right-handed parallel beta-helix repeat-containing protein [Massilia sp. TWP1-3-3]|uniref:right-handed parallel beta-helix repeat-containing protein n=1 Tax=Massilia sp. TWP1-3-3 TaxID=2804573 RepID=UPI003CEEFF69